MKKGWSFLPFLPIFYMGQSMTIFSSLALPGKELDWKLWLMGCPTLKAWFKAGAPWRQKHLVTPLQNPHQLWRTRCSNYISCLFGKLQAFPGLNYGVPDCKSLFSLTFQLQICGSCLLLERGLGEKLWLRLLAVVIVKIFIFLSVFTQFCVQLARFFFCIAPSVAFSLCFSVKQVGRMFFINFGPLLKGSMCWIVARGKTDAGHILVPGCIWHIRMFWGIKSAGAK